MKQSYTLRRGRDNGEIVQPNLIDIEYARSYAAVVSERINAPVTLYLVTETLVETINPKKEESESKCK